MKTELSLLETYWLHAGRALGTVLCADAQLADAVVEKTLFLREDIKDSEREAILFLRELAKCSRDMQRMLDYDSY